MMLLIYGCGVCSIWQFEQKTRIPCWIEQLHNRTCFQCLTIRCSESLISILHVDSEDWSDRSAAEGDLSNHRTQSPNLGSMLQRY